MRESLGLVVVNYLTNKSASNFVCPRRLAGRAAAGLGTAPRWLDGVSFEKEAMTAVMLPVCLVWYTKRDSAAPVKVL